MTKSEVRAVSLSKLELNCDSVLWDIGAGTGSVSVEALLCHPVKAVCAFEKNAEAVELIKKNREKAGVGNLTIVEGDALEQMSLAVTGGRDSAIKDEYMRRVTHAFIGGTSGEMGAIIDLLLSVNSQIRVVINVIALETLSTALECLSARGIEADIVAIQVSRAARAGRYHLMQGQNPVYIISFGGTEPFIGESREQNGEAGV